jgi:hypothetical protein
MLTIAWSWSNVMNPPVSRNSITHFFQLAKIGLGYILKMIEEWQL